jgi:hypothetical protein
MEFLKPVRPGEVTVAIEKKALNRKKLSVSTPTAKTQKTKAKVDTAKPAASRVVAAMTIHQ